jgi:hypothetical protein
MRPNLAQTGTMAGERIPSLILQIIDELRAHGVLITNRGGDWCVRAKGEPEETGYLTDDLEDAFEYGRTLAASRSALPVINKPPETGRKSRRPITAKTQRRRWFRAHNRRVRGRAIKSQREEGRDDFGR